MIGRFNHSITQALVTSNFGLHGTDAKKIHHEEHEGHEGHEEWDSSVSSSSFVVTNLCLLKMLKD